MKLLCISHPCVTPINQTLFARVEKLAGWDVSIVVPSSWRSSYGETEARRLPEFRGGLLPRPVILRGNIPLHLYRTSLRQIVEREAPDVLYVHHEPYALASAQAARSVAGRRPVLGFYSAQNLNKHYPWPIRRLEQFVFGQAQFAFPVSKSVEEVLRTKGFKGRTDVLPLWVDTKLFVPRARDQRAAGELVVGFAGRLETEKGVETLLAAMVELPNVRAIVAGEGSQSGALRRRASELLLGGRIEWRGYVPHETMPTFYDDIDLLVVPSRSLGAWREQFGRVVIEALACGIPVVASDSGELPRLVESIEGAVCFPEGDAVALAHAIHRFAEHPDERATLGAAAAAAVRDRFSVDAVARRFTEVVEDVLARPSRA